VCSQAGAWEQVELEKTFNIFTKITPMEYFYSENLSSRDKQIKLSEEESRHLGKVQRKKPGDRIQITNGEGLLAEAIVADEKSKSIICTIQSSRIIPSSPERNIHIALSTIRPNRMDWAVEKLTELGVGTISFFYSHFTSVRAFKVDHLRKIAISAIKQSQQAYLPQLNPPLPFSEWLHSFNEQENQMRLLAHLADKAQNMLKMQFDGIHLNRQSSIVVAIGPEGGFSKEELITGCEKGFRLVSLDNNILRTETAAVVAAAQCKLTRKEVEGI
jgi:16S rRNA (uracil1498-N3)-methyltransferase